MSASILLVYDEVLQPSAIGHHGAFNSWLFALQMVELRVKSFLMADG
jgi:hypothetical protein